MTPPPHPVSAIISTNRDNNSAAAFFLFPDIVSPSSYAREHHFPMTAGSDTHRAALFGGGVAFRRKILSSADYIRAILSGEDYLLTNGEMNDHPAPFVY